jgi:hypothetical protein
MSKNITEQIAELQNENDRLKELDKLFEKAVKAEFGCDRKKIHKLLENTTPEPSAFEKKIRAFFGLESSQDFADFQTIFCTENSLNYFNKNRPENSVSDAAQG